MDKLIGREVRMVLEPGMFAVGYGEGKIIFTASYVEQDGETNTLFLMESIAGGGEKLYTLGNVPMEQLVEDTENEGRFDNVCVLASNQAGHCCGVAGALRLLADKMDELETDGVTD